MLGICHRQTVNSSKGGFTLVEIVIVVAAMGILFGVLGILLSNMQTQKQQLLAENELKQNLMLAMTAINKDFTLAINAKWSENQLIIYQAKETIIYTLAEDAMAKEHLYPLEGNVLYRRTEGGRNQPMANFINTFSVQYDGQEFTVALTGCAYEQDYNLQQTFTPGALSWHYFY